MNWLAATIDELAAMTQWGYGSSAATEPTAWSALALAAHGRNESAALAQQWLVRIQQGNGMLGISDTQAEPHWPTGLAVLAWSLFPRFNADRLDHPYRNAISSAIRAILSLEGNASVRSFDQVDQTSTPVVGHDTTLVGWPWVEGTHTWLEPTAMFLLALKASGYGANSRAREAVKVLLDRQLPDGGCNYGNTFVLGQELRPQLEPSGLALLALGGVQDPSGRIAKTIEYVVGNTSAEVSTLSLSYALMGLAAHGKYPTEAHAWLGKALERSRSRGVSAQRLALAALAAMGTECPLVRLTQEVNS